MITDGNNDAQSAPIVSRCNTRRNSARRCACTAFEDDGPVAADFNAWASSATSPSVAEADAEAEADAVVVVDDRRLLASRRCPCGAFEDIDDVRHDTTRAVPCSAVPFGSIGVAI
jgi:hypothetical protein